MGLGIRHLLPKPTSRCGVGYKVLSRISPLFNVFLDQMDCLEAVCDNVDPIPYRNSPFLPRIP